MIKVANTQAVRVISGGSDLQRNNPFFSLSLSLLSLSLSLSLSFSLARADDLKFWRCGFCEFWISKEWGNTFLVHALTVGS